MCEYRHFGALTLMRPEIEDGVFGSNTKTLCQIWLNLP
jgi:hypothetical protein